MNKHLHNSLRALFLSLALLLSLPMLADEIDGINYAFDGKTKQAHVIAKIIGMYSGEVVIPESVEYGGTTYSVESIGGNAFYKCSGLTSVTIPNSVESIGRYAFSNCSGLTSLTIPNSVTSIGPYAFEGCSGLTSVTIGNSVTSISQGAFERCSGLTSVTIPNSVTRIWESVFSGCSGLTSVTIGNSVWSIEDSAFSGCSGLTSVTIPNSVTSIGGWAFSDCSGLTSVTIGNSVTSIWYAAFSGCSKLLDVYCYAVDVPFAQSNAFSTSNREKATLHVPAASIESYKATAPWSRFGKIVALTDEETGIDVLKQENGTRKSEIYDLSGRRVQKAQRGIFIQNGKKVMVR